MLLVSSWLGFTVPMYGVENAVTVAYDNRILHTEDRHGAL
jgi:hypothetical protein